MKKCFSKEFKEELKELTEAAWQTETRSWFQVVRSLVDLVWKDGTVNTWSQHKSGAVGKESKGEVLKGRSLMRDDLKAKQTCI